MEWVETTGNTIDEAKESALDELGVDEQDAEFEILEEPKTGLFGRVRSEGRVRARVRPTAPRPKEDRRDRRKGKAKGAAAGGPALPETSTTGTANDHASTEDGGPEPAEAAPGPRRNRNRRPAGSENAAKAPEQPVAETGNALATETVDEPRAGGRRPRGGGIRPGAGDESRRSARPQHSRSTDRAEKGPIVEVALEEQGRIAEEFLQGLLAQFGLTGQIAIQQPDEDNIDLDINGSDLGLLIGPKGATLLSIQDLTRTVVQHKTGAGNGRINVDVGGYRHKRSLALANFARQVAGQVQTSGERRALEAMGSADRKVVHDALTDFEGVETLSEGEDPRRRVVIVPASS
jgi:spoIIIJ-associated protein